MDRSIYVLSAGSTPLHAAVTNNCDPMVFVSLLNGGADANIEDGEGKTPWDRANEREFLKGTDAYWRLNDARFQ